MAEAKVVKMAQTVNEDGSVSFAFPSLGEKEVFSVSDFPQNVVEFFALLGMRTKLRNFTVPSADEKEATPEDMITKLRAGAAALKAGILRIARTGEEKAPASTLILEAALIYRKMKACAKVSGSPEGWAETEVKDTVESLRPMVESMDDTITNEAKVEEARAAAVAKGEDGDAAAKAAAITQLDQLKATTLFKLAMSEAKAAREKAKKAALTQKAMAEAEAAGGF